jgi:serine/threonine-protein kinase RsbW
MSEHGRAGWRHEVVLPSERGASRLVLDDLLEQLAAHGWQQSDIFGIHLAAEEAIVNAIVHGNQLDPAKTVRVVCDVTAEAMRIEIVDEGPGFDPSTVPDCTREDRLEIPSGRGLMLMRSFMTKIEHLGRGNAVVLEKVRSAADSQG